MAKQSKKSSEVKENTKEQVNIFLKGVNQTMRDGAQIERAQVNIEKYQLAVAQKQVQINKQAEQFAKKLKASAERSHAAAQAGITLQSDFSGLQKLYNEQMKKYNFDTLYEYHRYKLASTYALTNEKQHKVLNEYCRLIAEKSIKAIEYYVNILKQKGMLKDVKKEEEQPEQVATV